MLTLNTSSSSSAFSWAWTFAQRRVECVDGYFFIRVRGYEEGPNWRVRRTSGRGGWPGEWKVRMRHGGRGCEVSLKCLKRRLMSTSASWRAMADETTRPGLSFLISMYMEGRIQRLH